MEKFNQDLPSIVLGGGGAFGIGYESGILDEFRERGAEFQDAQVLGTSAGAWVGGFIGMAKNYDDVTSKVKTIKAPNRKPGYLQELTREVFGDDRAANVSAVALQLPKKGARKPRAVKLNGGDYDLADIVAASSAVPGIFHSVQIGEHRYWDGGVRSIVSADLAPRSHTVLAIAAMTQHFMPPVGPVLELQLQRELKKWGENNGGKVVYIRPNRAIGELIHSVKDCFSIEIGKRAYEMARHQAADLLDNRESIANVFESMCPQNQDPRGSSENE